jgi:acetyl esterase/lipase
VASINYRLSGESIFPTQVYDCKTAVRWLRAHAKEYNLDPNRIAVAGESAGGHLAALTGTSGDVKDLEDLSAGNADESSRVRAVVDWYGPTDLLAVDGYLLQNGYKPWLNNSSSYASQLVGGNLTEHADVVRAANPETYITPDDPPFLIQHGTRDNHVPHQQSVIFAEKLRPVIGEENVALDIFKGGRHGDMGSDIFFETPANFDIVFDFLDKHLA